MSLFISKLIVYVENFKLSREKRKKKKETPLKLISKCSKATGCKVISLYIPKVNYFLIYPSIQRVIEISN